MIQIINQKLGFCPYLKKTYFKKLGFCPYAFLIYCRERNWYRIIIPGTPCRTTFWYQIQKAAGSRTQKIDTI